MATEKRKQHVRDLIEIRFFIRNIIENPLLGRDVVANTLSQLNWFSTLREIFKEECNQSQGYVNNSPNELFYRVDKEGNRMIAQPAIDMSIVCEEYPNLEDPIMID